MTSASYTSVRPFIKQGDVIAFSGGGFVSRLIKFVTRSHVSHVGVVKFSDAESGRIDLVESTTLSNDRLSGVRTRRLSEVVAAYKGSVVWLKLKADARRKFDAERFFNYVLSQEGRPYDYFQAIMSGLRIPTPELDAHQFCSELIAFAFQEAGILDKWVNASETTPAELCRFPIYEAPVLLKGSEIKI